MPASSIGTEQVPLVRGATATRTRATSCTLWPGPACLHPPSSPSATRLKPEVCCLAAAAALPTHAKKDSTASASSANGISARSWDTRRCAPEETRPGVAGEHQGVSVPHPGQRSGLGIGDSVAFMSPGNGGQGRKERVPFVAQGNANRWSESQALVAGNWNGGKVRPRRSSDCTARDALSPGGPGLPRGVADGSRLGALPVRRSGPSRRGNRWSSTARKRPRRRRHRSTDAAFAVSSRWIPPHE